MNALMFAAFSQRALWPLLLEMCASVVWSYAMVAVTAAWLAGLVLPAGAVPAVGSPLGVGGWIEDAVLAGRQGWPGS